MPSQPNSESPPPSAPTGEWRGTSIHDGGRIKAASDEAKLVTCPECGRFKDHSRFCPRKSK